VQSNRSAHERLYRQSSNWRRRGLFGIPRASCDHCYGDTENGGGTGCFGAGCGTVYKVSKTGALVHLHIFAGSEGAMPFGGVILDTKGNLYGTAFLGGGDYCARFSSGSRRRLLTGGRRLSLFQQTA